MPGLLIPSRCREPSLCCCHALLVRVVLGFLIPVQIMFGDPSLNARGAGPPVVALRTLAMQASIGEAIAAEAQAEGQNDAAQVRGLANSTENLVQAGRYSEALPQAKNLLDLCNLVYDRDHLETINARIRVYALERIENLSDEAKQRVDKARLLHQQGQQLARQKKFAESERSFSDALVLRRAALGTDHPHTLESLRSLGAALVEQEKHDLAVPHLLEHLSQCCGVYGPFHPKRLTALNDAALACSPDGQHDKAADLYAHLHALGSIAWGAGDERLPRLRQAWASSFRAAGDPAFAKAVLEEVPSFARLGEGDFRISKNQPGGKVTYAQQILIDEFQSMGNDYIETKRRLPRGRGIALLERVAVLLEELFGPRHASLGMLSDLAALYEERGDFQKALTIWQRLRDRPPIGSEEDLVRRAEAGIEVMTRLQALSNAEQRKYMEACGLEPAARRAGLFSDHTSQVQIYETQRQAFADILGKDTLPYVEATLELASARQRMDNSILAIRLFEEALPLYVNLLGEDSRDVLDYRTTLSESYLETGQVRKARENLEEVRRRGGGSVTLLYLARIYIQSGEFEQAKELLMELQAKVDESDQLGNDTETGRGLMAAGFFELASARGDYAAALTWSKIRLDSVKKSWGEEGNAYTAVLAWHGVMLGAVRDSVEGISCLRQAVRAYDRMGERRDSLIARGAIVNLLNKRKDRDSAEALVREMLADAAKHFTEDSPEYGSCLSQLAQVLERQGKLKEAKQHLEQSLSIRRGAKTKSRQLISFEQLQLARVLAKLGDHKQAAALATQVNETISEGRDFVSRARKLGRVARVFLIAGDHQSARQILEEALPLQERFLQESFSAQSNRQRLGLLANSRSALDMYLGLPEALRPDIARQYDRVLAWKAAVASRMSADRIARDDPEVEPQIQQLEELRNRYSRMAFSKPSPEEEDVWHEHLTALKREKEALEAELAAGSVEFRRQTAQVQPTSERLMRALPQGMALVEFLQRDDHNPGTDGPKSYLTAFVLRAGKQVARVELGDAQHVSAQVDAWHEALKTGDDAALFATARRLREMVWQPLEPHIAQSGTVLVAPDGPICRLPIGALPGRRPTTFLIEDFAIGYTISGGFALAAFEDADASATDGLLAVGGIRYPNAGDSNLAVASSLRDLSNLRDLPGTELEMHAVADLFKRHHPAAETEKLQGIDPTESGLKRSLESSSWRYVHLACHGFFTPPEPNASLRSGAETGLVKSGLDSGGGSFHLDPNLLSGLVVARSPGDRKTGDDGFLPCEELMGIDLHGTDLVVLSACETGLGEVAGGEGVLGLQRAFRVAGAHAVVASLWKVDDAATSVLMEEFYNNLWERRLGKLEALRQAQLTVLGSPNLVNTRREQLNQKLGQRGVEIVPAKPRPATIDRGRRAHPRLWAAWIHSGEPN